MDIQKKTFEIFYQLEDAKTVDEVRELVLSLTREFGGDFLMCGRIRAPNEAPNPTPVFGTFDHQWFRAYMRNYFFIEDPAPLHANKVNTVFTWKDLIDNKQLTNGQLVVMKEPTNHGLSCEGVVVPIHRAGQEFATNTIAGEYFLVGESAESKKLIKNALATISARAYQRAVEILHEDKLLLEKAQQTLRENPLSPRQLEVLTWMAKGKENREIGELLIPPVTARTVKLHVQEIFNTLGVSNRIMAVERGKQLQLIGYDPVQPKV